MIEKCLSLGFYEFIVNDKIALFQTKTSWKKASTLDLILRSTYRMLVTIDKNKRYDLNFPGIGLGGLKREKVLPIISVLPDNVNVWEYEN